MSDNSKVTLPVFNFDAVKGVLVSLRSGLNIANKSGSYTLDEASVLKKQLDSLVQLVITVEEYQKYYTNKKEDKDNNFKPSIYDINKTKEILSGIKTGLDIGTKKGSYTLDEAFALKKHYDSILQIISALELYQTKHISKNNLIEKEYNTEKNEA